MEKKIVLKRFAKTKVLNPEGSPCDGSLANNQATKEETKKPIYISDQTFTIVTHPYDKLT